MAKRNKTAYTAADPTLKTVQVEIQGKTYTLCFDMGALAEAETHFRRAGQDVNLLNAFTEATVSSVRIMFPCAVRKFHPELDFHQAQALIDSSVPAMYAVAAVIGAAWQQSMPEPDREDKPETPPVP